MLRYTTPDGSEHQLDYNHAIPQPRKPPPNPLPPGFTDLTVYSDPGAKQLKGLHPPTSLGSAGPSSNPSKPRASQEPGPFPAASTLNPYAVDSDASGQANNPSSQSLTGMRDFNLNQSKSVHDWLFSQLNASTNLEHPMCESCTDVLGKIMSRKLADATREKARYIEFGNQRRAYPTKPAEALSADIDKVAAEESAAITTLQQLEAQLERLKVEIGSLEAESQALDAQEASYWRELNAYQLQLDQFQNERDSTEAKYNYDQKQLHILHTTSIYNDLFNIGSRHGIGTINGLRLGRLPPEHPVEWTEINAAWGQTLLALYTIAAKLKFEFQGYRLNPQGSYSSVERLLPGGAYESYELFLPPDSFSRIWLVRRYNSAMAGFLTCLDQVASYVKSLDPNFRLNYRISKEAIGNYSIHLQYNSYPIWTKALRCTLSDIKSLLAFDHRLAIRSYWGYARLHSKA
ncbi:Vacuolar protein sorting-associated protein atg6 [Massospora cicadina]|nr:Vacuolar protein sorting-associated protein atg6 [Massospora cicadina]